MGNSESRCICMYRELQAGDHIAVRRSGGYSHHGIYVGEVEGVKYVIHFIPASNKESSFSSKASSFSSRAGTSGCRVCGFNANLHFGVVKTCLDCFLEGDSVHLMHYSDSQKLKPCDEVINTAFQLLKDGFGFFGYNLLLNNCEHFANFCKTGIHYSDQVGKVALFGFLPCMRQQVPDPCIIM